MYRQSEKIVKQQYLSTCPHNMVNFGLLMAEIRWRVWDTPANLNEFRVLFLLFLANVNSCSRSLYAIARPSVCLSLIVCLSSVVCNVRALYSGGSNFRQCFYGIWYLGHPLTSTENFREIVPGKPLHRGEGVKDNRGSKI